MSESHNWVVASAALFFVPATISVFTQNLLVSIIYFGSALFSTLYHAYDETQFVEEDLLFAILAIVISLVVLAVIARHFSWYSWRILVPLLSGVTGVGIYFCQGQLSLPEPISYEIYHSIWHLLMALSATFLVFTRVDLSEARFSYAELFTRSLDATHHAK